MKRSLIILLLLLSTNFSATAQKGVTTFGIQYRPIIPNRLIGFYEQEFNDPPFYSSVKQRFGNNLGMLVRVGLSKRISLETGINFTQRNFGLTYAVPDSGYSATDKVRVIGYSIPVSCLVFIRLADEWYMNTSLGVAVTAFPSDVSTNVPIGASNEFFLQEGAYKSKVQGSALANIGWEYRTKSKGYWYLGASYHLPFIPIMTFAMSYEYPAGENLFIDNIRGSYLTLDFRYYFHENKKKE